MKIKWRHVSAVLAVVGVCGCSQVVAGTPKSVDPNSGGASSTFGVAVAPGDRQKLDVAQQVRSVDPCGFFDQAKIATYGQISTLGPYQQVGECQIGFLQTNRIEYHTHITVSLNSYPPYAAETKKQIAGEEVVVDKVRNSNGNCAYKVPLRFPTQSTGSSAVPDIVEVPTLAYATVRSSMATPDAFGCQVVEETITNMVAMFRENRIPRRDHALVEVPLTRRSPCELMQHLPPKYHVEKLDAETDPYGCTFYLESGGPTPFSNDMTSIDFQLGDESSMNLSRGEESAQVNGKPVVIERNTAVGEPSCFVRFPVGPVVDGYIPGTPATDSAKLAARKQVMVRLHGVCRVTNDLIRPAVDLFGANA